jgi:TonB family protein
MAKCPQCGKYYDDAMSFCLDDGSYLLADGHSASETPTADYRNSPTLNKIENDTIANPSVATIGNVRASGTSPSAVIVVVLFIVGGFVLIGALGFAGLMFYKASGTDYNRTTSTPTPPVRNSPTPLDTLGASDPIKTDDSTYPDNKVTKDPRTVDVRKEGPGVIDDTTAPPPPLSLRDRSENPANGKRVPKQISGGVLNGKAISLPKPPYPPAARAVRASGSVSVQVLVDENGNVVSASALNGHPLLRAAATSAARGAKFYPTLLSGKPVKVSGVIMYNFVP